MTRQIYKLAVVFWPRPQNKSPRNWFPRSRMRPWKRFQRFRFLKWISTKHSISRRAQLRLRKYSVKIARRNRLQLFNYRRALSNRQRYNSVKVVTRRSRKLCLSLTPRALLFCLSAKPLRRKRRVGLRRTILLARLQRSYSFRYYLPRVSRTVLRKRHVARCIARKRSIRVGITARRLQQKVLHRRRALLRPAFWLKGVGVTPLSFLQISDWSFFYRGRRHYKPYWFFRKGLLGHVAHVNALSGSRHRASSIQRFSRRQFPRLVVCSKKKLRAQRNTRLRRSLHAKQYARCVRRRRSLLRRARLAQRNYERNFLRQQVKRRLKSRMRGRGIKRGVKRTYNRANKYKSKHLSKWVKRWVYTAVKKRANWRRGAWLRRYRIKSGVPIHSKRRRFYRFHQLLRFSGRRLSPRLSRRVIRRLYRRFLFKRLRLSWHRPRRSAYRRYPRMRRFRSRYRHRWHSQLRARRIELYLVRCRAYRQSRRWAHYRAIRRYRKLRKQRMRDYRKRFRRLRVRRTVLLRLCHRITRRRRRLSKRFYSNVFVHSKKKLMRRPIGLRARIFFFTPRKTVRLVRRISVAKRFSTLRKARVLLHERLQFWRARRVDTRRARLRRPVWHKRGLPLSVKQRVKKRFRMRRLRKFKRYRKLIRKFGTGFASFRPARRRRIKKRRGSYRRIFNFRFPYKRSRRALQPVRALSNQLKNRFRLRFKNRRLKTLTSIISRRFTRYYHASCNSYVHAVGRIRARRYHERLRRVGARRARLRGARIRRRKTRRILLGAFTSVRCRRRYVLRRSRSNLKCRPFYFFKRNVRRRVRLLTYYQQQVLSSKTIFLHRMNFLHLGCGDSSRLLLWTRSSVVPLPSARSLSAELSFMLNNSVIDFHDSASRIRFLANRRVKQLPVWLRMQRRIRRIRHRSRSMGHNGLYCELPAILAYRQFCFIWSVRSAWTEKCAQIYFFVKLVIYLQYQYSLLCKQYLRLHTRRSTLEPKRRMLVSTKMHTTSIAIKSVALCRQAIVPVIIKQTIADDAFILREQQRTAACWLTCASKSIVSSMLEDWQF